MGRSGIRGLKAMMGPECCISRGEVRLDKGGIQEEAEEKVTVLP